MTSQQSVTTRSGEVAKPENDPRLMLFPAVDIFENGDAISLYADLPGVTESSLSLEVEDKTLTIQGDIAINMPDDLESLHADVRSTRYRRAFTLSAELDSAKIEASLSNGLLTVRVPKREELKPRKIEITAR